MEDSIKPEQVERYREMANIDQVSNCNNCE